MLLILIRIIFALELCRLSIGWLSLTRFRLFCTFLGQTAVCDAPMEHAQPCSPNLSCAGHSHFDNNCSASRTFPIFRVRRSWMIDDWRLREVLPCFLLPAARHLFGLSRTPVFSSFSVYCHASEQRALKTSWFWLFSSFLHDQQSAAGSHLCRRVTPQQILSGARPSTLGQVIVDSDYDMLWTCLCQTSK